MNLFNDDPTGLGDEEEVRQELRERLEKLSKFSPSELKMICIDSGAPHEELIDILFIIFHTNLDFEDKIEILKSRKYGVEVLYSLATMERE